MVLVYTVLHPILSQCHQSQAGSCTSNPPDITHTLSYTQTYTQTFTNIHMHTCKMSGTQWKIRFYPS
jgi:hypothetical protein